MSTFSLSDREQQHFGELFASLDHDKEKKLDLRRTSEFLSKCDLPIDQFEQVHFFLGFQIVFNINWVFYPSIRFLKFAGLIDWVILVEVNSTSP